PESANQDLAPSFKDDALQFEDLPDVGFSAMVQLLLDLSTEFTHRRRTDIVDWSDLRLIEVTGQFQGPAIYMQQLPRARKDQNARSRARRCTLRARLRMGQFLFVPHVWFLAISYHGSFVH